MKKKEMLEKSAPWMDIAWHEYFLWDEEQLTLNNYKGYNRVQGYINITREQFTPISNGWCGCFIDWVLKKTNIFYNKNYSTVILNPASSQNYAMSERYPNSKRINPRLNKIPYGTMAVLHLSDWHGHVGFVVNKQIINGNIYIYLLGGNQKDKVCVQEFIAYREGKNILYKTKKGTIYVLKGYFYPSEYDLETLGDKAYEYCTEGYFIEERISSSSIQQSILSTHK